MTVDKTGIDKLGINSVTNLEVERGNVLDTRKNYSWSEFFSSLPSPLSPPHLEVYPEHIENYLQAGCPQPLPRQLDLTKTAAELVS